MKTICFIMKTNTSHECYSNCLSDLLEKGIGATNPKVSDMLVECFLP